jgi:ABC-type thiamine transport system ATPase subunit
MSVQSPPRAITRSLSDSRRVLHRDARAVRQDGRIQIVSLDDVRAAHAEFMVLQEGRIQFHGNAQELLASQEPFLQEFPYRTLPPW